MCFGSIRRWTELAIKPHRLRFWAGRATASSRVGRMVLVFLLRCRRIRKSGAGIAYYGQVTSVTVYAHPACEHDVSKDPNLTYDPARSSAITPATGLQPGRRAIASGREEYGGRGCGKNSYQGGRRKGSRSRSKACQRTLGLDRRFDVRGRK